MYLTHGSGRAISGCSGVFPSTCVGSGSTLENVWVSGSLHPPSQGFGRKLTYSDSRAPSGTAVGTYGPFATQGSAGLFEPTPGHLSISEYGEDSGQREKSGDQREWILKEGSGDTGTREQVTEKSGRRGAGGYQLPCFAGSRSG